MIYGAYGYSGRLIAELAAERGLRPVLAGRDGARLARLGERLALDTLTVDLARSKQLLDAVSKCHTVLHCAGPFSATARPMLEACVAGRTNYLDITGEISVFEAAHALDSAARDAGIVVCPGVGFDVIPTDCVAAQLKEALPSATHLSLGFDSRSILSPGTAKTAVEGLAQGGCVREDGKLRQVPLAYRTRRIDFGDGEKLAMTIPWGDVSTAFYSTGIPNIQAYIPASPRLVKQTRRLNYLRGLLGLGFVQRILKNKAKKSMTGPDNEALQKSQTYVWGEARDDAGNIKTARLVTGNGYKVTAHGALGIAQHLLGSDQPGGFYTPSKLVGSDFISKLEGCGRISIE
ncbi:MAG: hypothetical protein HKN59_05320 [Gammaproteobacteria bacterium]|nr:hypothetical protein [Gammaproteobacteria bacterium]